jgi:cytochrome c-type biogenesis protein CcmF
MTEAAINDGMFRDLYAAMGEPLGGGAWSFRLYYKPMIRWIWMGCLMMGFGGLLAVSDKRYRQRIKQSLPMSANTSTSTASHQA